MCCFCRYFRIEMFSLQEDYNTQRSPLDLSEYGRHIQDYLQHIQSLPEKSERTAWVYNLVQIMSTLNPEIKQQANYKEILWSHILHMSNFNLDVDCPYPIVRTDAENNKPATIGYPDANIRFRFYGRNLQMMIDRAASMEPSDLRQDLVNMIASFMYNSCKAWNNENLSNEVIADHLMTLSKGKLQLSGEEITVSADTQLAQPNRNWQQGKKNHFQRNNKNNKNNRNNNRNGKNYRRF